MNTKQISETSKETSNEKREGTYKPRISAEHLRKLWLRKQETGKTIVELVSEALELYFETIRKGVRKNADNTNGKRGRKKEPLQKERLQ